MPDELLSEPRLRRVICGTISTLTDAHVRARFAQLLTCLDRSTEDLPTTRSGMRADEPSKLSILYSLIIQAIFRARRGKLRDDFVARIERIAAAEPGTYAIIGNRSIGFAMSILENKK